MLQQPSHRTSCRVIWLHIFLLASTSWLREAEYKGVRVRVRALRAPHEPRKEMQGMERQANDPRSLIRR